MTFEQPLNAIWLMDRIGSILMDNRLSARGLKKLGGISGNGKFRISNRWIFVFSGVWKWILESFVMVLASHNNMPLLKEQGEKFVCSLTVMETERADWMERRASANVMMI